jgi:hypothetical protein
MKSSDQVGDTGSIELKTFSNGSSAATMSRAQRVNNVNIR